MRRLGEYRKGLPLTSAIVPQNEQTPGQTTQLNMALRPSTQRSLSDCPADRRLPRLGVPNQWFSVLICLARSVYFSKAAQNSVALSNSHSSPSRSGRG